MDIARIAQQRYTTKAFDPSRTIPQETIEQLRTLLRAAPSSVNSQPWHFFIAATPEGKAQVGQGTAAANYAYNAAKIANASHVVVLCARTDLDDAYLSTLLAQEAADGRFPTPEGREMQAKTRGFYVTTHRDALKDLERWTEKQVYLALGTLLLGAGALGIHACPMEGFDHAALDAALGLKEKGLRSVVMVALGYSGEGDFNARLPKSRLPEETIFTTL